MKNFLIILLFPFCALPVAAQTVAADSARIDSLVRTLPEVMVSGERPVVRVEGSALVYDVGRMPGSATADNAYEALKTLPGVIETGGSLTLSGQAVTLILDGRATSLTQEQLALLLKGMPKDRLENVEVMYNAPARYQVGGACININLKHETAGRQTLTGEAFAAYDQSRRAAFQERATIVYAGRKLTADLMYSLNHGQSYSTTAITSHHGLADGTVHDISSLQRTVADGHNHSLRLSLGYNFSDKHRLALSYYATSADTENRQATTGSINATNRLDSSPLMHNLSLDYSLPSGTNIGAEYTYYRNPQTQTLGSILADRTLDYVSDSRQTLDIWKVYARQTHALKAGWGLNYGAYFTWTIDHSRQTYRPTGEATGTLPGDQDTRRRENTLNAYAGFSKNFNNKIIVDASLAAQRYDNRACREWSLLPTVNLTYIPAQGHILQLGLSSTAAYPEYWAVQDFTAYSNGGYDEIKGNPGLKPSRDYTAGLVYVLLNKYVFRGWFSYIGDLFMQTLYQRPDHLTETFRYVNFDFQQQAGLMASAPLKAGRWYTGNLTAVGVWMRHKDSDFYDIPFDRSIAYGMLTLNNDFTLASKPEIKLSLNGSARTRAIQGNYDLPASGSVSAALQVRFLKDKRATLKLYCSDIFETSQIDPYIDFKGQRFSMSMSSFRHLGLSFSYAFGNYKEKQHKEVDTSRFRK